MELMKRRGESHLGWGLGNIWRFLRFMTFSWVCQTTGKQAGRQAGIQLGSKVKVQPATGCPSASSWVKLAGFPVAFSLLTDYLCSGVVWTVTTVGSQAKVWLASAASHQSYFISVNTKIIKAVCDLLPPAASSTAVSTSSADSYLWSVQAIMIYGPNFSSPFDVLQLVFVAGGRACEHVYF